VIEKRPELFKIDCLRRLQGLFTDPTPYFAGYGNRPNDVLAYQVTNDSTTHITASGGRHPNTADIPGEQAGCPLGSGI
jgi:phosphatidate phosphatase PAH1